MNESETREVDVNGVKVKMIVSSAPPGPPPSNTASSIGEEDSGHAALAGQPALASVSTLCNSAIGAGVLSLPFAFHKAGALGGVLLCASIGVAEAFTLYVLSKMAERYGAMSYGQLVRATLGKKMATFLSLLMVVYMWGACNAYLVILGDVFSSLGRSLAGPDSWAADRQVIIAALGLGILLPLCFVRRLGALAALSSVAVLGFLYTAGVVVAIALKVVAEREDPWEGVDLIRLDVRALFAVPIVVFGFNCHANAVPIFQELVEEPKGNLLPSIKSRRKTSKLVNMISVILAAVALIMVGYLAVGLAGYLAFPDARCSNILNALPQDDPWVQAARLFIGIVVAGHYPLNHHPARAGALDLAQLAGVSEATRESVIAPLFTLAFVLSSVALSLCVTDLGEVIHIIGGTASVMMIFFNPGFMLINAGIIKHSTTTLNYIRTVSGGREADPLTASGAAAAALSVPLLQAAAEKGIKKTGLVYSPGKSWAAGLALVALSIAIMVITLVTTFIRK